MTKDDIYILLQDLPGGAIKIICHVQINEPDPITNNPFTIFRQEMYVTRLKKATEYDFKSEIIYQIIRGFEEIQFNLDRFKK